MSAVGWNQLVYYTYLLMSQADDQILRETATARERARLQGRHITDRQTHRAPDDGKYLWLRVEWYGQ